MGKIEASILLKDLGFSKEEFLNFCRQCGWQITVDAEMFYEDIMDELMEE